MQLSNPTPVRLTAGTGKQLRKLSRETNVSVAALIRLAVTAGLPSLLSQFGKADQATETKLSEKDTAA